MRRSLRSASWIFIRDKTKARTLAIAVHSIPPFAKSAKDGAPVDPSDLGVEIRAAGPPKAWMGLTEKRRRADERQFG